MPYFKGGDSDLFKFINKNRKYPQKAKDNCKSGVVYVRFIIDSLGNINSAASRNIVGFDLDEEAVRIVNLSSGLWNPGLKNKIPTNFKYEMPIRFTANDECIPKYVEYQNSGNKFFEKGKYEKAILEYDKVLSMQPYNPDALFKKGLSKLKLGSIEEACENWQTIPDVLNEKAVKYLSEYCN
jgi:TonB family protein